MEDKQSSAAAVQAAPARPAPFYIPSLDGIRAVSFLIVFVSHAGLGHIVPGGFGVTVFFFLSGYLITTLLRMECERSGTVDLGGFYLRRVLRIFPPYYAVLALAALTAVPGELDPSTLVPQLLYLANYSAILRGGFDGMAPGTGVYWSLAVEEHFYLFFPLLYLLLHRRVPSRRAQAVALGAACALVLAWRVVLVQVMDAPELRTYVATDTRIDSILFGCLLAVVGNPMLDDQEPRGVRWLAVWVPVAIAALLLSLLYRDPVFRETLRYTVQGLALIPLFVVAIQRPSWPVIRWLNARTIRRLGVLSYGLYLLHQVVIYRLETVGLHPLLLGALALGLSVVLAELLHRGVEQPSLLLRRRLQRKAPRPVAPPVQATDRAL